MAARLQELTEDYAIYQGDSCQILPSLPKASVHLSVYSPPFCGIFLYSSSPQDLSNNVTYEGFLEHYSFLVTEIARLTMPGRLSCVHCMDIPNPGQKSGYYDFPGKVIALHEAHGFYYFGRVAIWKEPLKVAIRTRLKHLTHKQVTKDSTESTIAAGDVLLLFKRAGTNTIPVAHTGGFETYAGAMAIPDDVLKYRGGTVQQENKYSQWIWRRYAACVWDDIRLERVLPYKTSKEPDDERHVHPLQLDVIERCVQLWSNPGETVLTPFMGVGSEVFGAVANGRRGIGVELKRSYFMQARTNLLGAKSPAAQEELFRVSAMGVPDEGDADDD